MVGNTVSRNECERIHSDLNKSIQQLHDDVVGIRENHFPHMDEKIEALSKKIDMLQTALIVVGILAGINVLDIILKTVGV